MGREGKLLDFVAITNTVSTNRYGGSTFEHVRRVHLGTHYTMIQQDEIVCIHWHIRNGSAKKTSFFASRSANLCLKSSNFYAPSPASAGPVVPTSVHRYHFWAKMQLPQDSTYTAVNNTMRCCNITMLKLFFMSGSWLRRMRARWRKHDMYQWIGPTMLHKQINQTLFIESFG